MRSRNIDCVFYMDFVKDTRKHCTASVVKHGNIPMDTKDFGKSQQQKIKIIYFSGDDVAFFICILFFRNRFTRNVFYFIPLKSVRALHQSYIFKTYTWHASHAG